MVASVGQPLMKDIESCFDLDSSNVNFCHTPMVITPLERVVSNWNIALYQITHCTYLLSPQAREYLQDKKQNSLQLCSLFGGEAKDFELEKKIQRHQSKVK